MDKEAIQAQLALLRPDVPWVHYFDFGNGLTSVSADQPKSYQKAVGLGRFGDLVASITEPSGKRVLDLASAEGGHSVAFARAGAREVVGIEGRQLYVDRATFAAKALGLDNVRFMQGDVRKIPAEIGRFDIVLCSGILYHIDSEHFEIVVRSLYELTTDMVVLSTHVATPWALGRYRLTGPVKAGPYEGYSFREHNVEDTPEMRQSRLRASLDNPQSFWPLPDELIRALSDVGFKRITEQIKPGHYTAFEERQCRPLLVLRR
jgi:hypothetical protein